MRFARTLRAAIALPLALQLTAGAERRCLVFPEITGSAPETSDSYQCMADLNGKPFVEHEFQACLTTVLSSGFFVSGTLDAQIVSDGDEWVTFKLRAPDLPLTAIDYQLPELEKPKIVEWLSRFREGLKVGIPYGYLRRNETEVALKYYFQTRGESVGITSNIYLDYSRGVSRAEFKVYPGPRIAPKPPPPPWGKECVPIIHVLNWMDIDDRVPEPLVQRLIKTRGNFTCLSQDLIQADRHALAASGIFYEASISVSGPADLPDVNFHLRGMPLKIRSIAVEGYGLLNGELHPDHPLSFGPGDQYNRSTVLHALEALKKSYSKPGVRIDVSEDEELSKARDLDVKLQILAYEESRVIVAARLARP